MFTLPFLLFVVAQGGAIFVTAWLGAKLLNVTSRLAKVGLMLGAYAFWVALTLSGYFLAAGGGGLMEGFGFMLTLCLTALISTFFYAVFWALVPARENAANG